MRNYLTGSSMVENASCSQIASGSSVGYDYASHVQRKNVWKYREVCLGLHSFDQNAGCLNKGSKY